MRTPDLPDRPAAVRRAPYGSNPVLGRHGSRAREEILDAARRMFAERGYHGTTVEAIGTESGRSGASVYQYFEGKGGIFRVLVDELTADVLPQARELGAAEPAPAADDLESLRGRVARLAVMLERHATTLSLWPVAEQDEQTLAGSTRRFVDAFAEMLSPRLAAAGVPAARRRGLAIGIAAMVQWSHLTRSARVPAMPVQVLDDVLTRVLYLALYPASRPGVAPVGPPVRRPERPDATRPSADPGVVPGVRRRITDRNRPTLQRLTAAATTAFRRNGFVGTSINDIAVEAGVSHASVYTYWPDRSGVFTTLAHEASVALSEHLERAEPVTGLESACHWLEGWFELVARYGSVLFIWTHEALHDPRLGPLAAEMERYVNGHLDVLLRTAPTAGTLDTGASHVVLWSLLTDFPYALSLQVGAVSRRQALDILTTMVTHGLLGYR
jgi:AcrR family transcriptional regulator